MTSKLTLFLFSCLFALASIMTGQTNPEEGVPAKEEDEFAKKKVETKLTEVIPTDSLGSDELMKRAISWIKVESPKYKKSSGTTAGNKAECSASFPVKPKELNPDVDFTGKITMKVVIEVKNSKYKYTVSDIRHVSKSGQTSGGSIDNVVPECGSMQMTEIVWKKLKGEALRGAARVVADLKVGMATTPVETAADEW
jgi:hypothetical protein